MSASRLKLPRLSPADTGDIARQFAPEMSPKKDTGYGVQSLLALVPRYHTAFLQLATALRKGPLPPKERELAVMYMAARRKIWYLWGEHLPRLTSANVSDAQIEALKAGDPTQFVGFSESEKLAIEVSMSLTNDRRLSQELWDQSCQTWGMEGAIDLIFALAFYGGLVGTLADAIGLDLSDTGAAKA